MTMKKQVILVTGASSGIGKATALHLINEGHIVYGAARRIDKMKDLEDAGGRIIKMDVTIHEDVESCVRKIITEEGKIDVLVNNAGYAVYGSVEDVSIEDAKRQFEVNIFGLADITKEVIPHMRKENNGKIINITSVGGKIYTLFGAWYHATKHALEGWSDCLRLELKPFNIDVVIVEPGLIGTEFGDVLLQPMIDRSRGGAYEVMTDKMAKGSQEMYSKPGAFSEPTVIAKAISEAISASKPKTRYARGKLAKPLIWMRKNLSDRTFDKVIMSQVK